MPNVSCVSGLNLLFILGNNWHFKFPASTCEFGVPAPECRDRLRTPGVCLGSRGRPRVPRQTSDFRKNVGSRLPRGIPSFLLKLEVPSRQSGAPPSAETDFGRPEPLSAVQAGSGFAVTICLENALPQVPTKIVKATAISKSSRQELQGVSGVVPFPNLVGRP